MGRMSPARAWLTDKLPLALFLLSLMFLTFVAGILASVAEIFPAEQVRNAYRAGTALYTQLTRFSDPLSTDLWVKARTPKTGLTIHEPDQAHPGLTLFTSGHAPKAFLLSMDGEILHEWHKPFSAVWDKSSPVRRPVQDRQVYFNKARLYPDGGLLAIYIGVGDSPYGYGMVRLDRDSNVVWKNLDRFHHDMDIGEDGRIYGLTHHYRSKPPHGTDLKLPILDDFLTVVSPSDGRTLKTISLLDAFNASDFRRLLWLVPSYSMADPLHTNGVDILDAQDAARLGTRVPAAAEGQVLLSFRELAGGTLALLDVETEEIVWATMGPWMSQHDPDVLPNGNLLVFDNRGKFGPGGQTRVIEFNPGNGEVAWTYGGDRKHHFESFIRGSQQRLPNGNTFITEDDGGRLLEVTADGTTVWEYINPVRDEREGKRIPVLSWAERIESDTLSAEFRASVEGNPLLAEETNTQ